jgi:hypothetical protein
MISEVLAMCNSVRANKIAVAVIVVRPSERRNQAA